MRSSTARALPQRARAWPDRVKAISENFYTTVCDSWHTILRRGPNRMKPIKTAGTDTFPNAEHIDDIRLAASKMSLVDRRAFQAEMAIKYCGGSARRAEDIFGWSRDAVQLGLHEKRTGIVCLSAQSLFGGDKLWEEKHPEAADALWSLAQSHSQQDPSFRGPLSYTRLTAAEALRQLRAEGFSDEFLPSASTMAHDKGLYEYPLKQNPTKCFRTAFDPSEAREARPSRSAMRRKRSVTPPCSAGAIGQKRISRRPVGGPCCGKKGTRSRLPHPPQASAQPIQ